jgi:hypothetical protein
MARLTVGYSSDLKDFERDHHRLVADALAYLSGTA